MIRAATFQRRRAVRRPSHHAGNRSAAPGPAWGWRRSPRCFVRGAVRPTRAPAWPPSGQAPAADASYSGAPGTVPAAMLDEDLSTG
jgi:hypothetical protein